MATKTKNPTKGKTSTARARPKASLSKANAGKAGQRGRAAAADEIAAGIVAEKGKRGSAGSAGASAAKTPRRHRLDFPSMPEATAPVFVIVDGVEHFDAAPDDKIPSSLRLPACVGRPTLYRPIFATMALQLAARGLSIGGIAGRFNVARDTLYAWAAKYPEFSDSLKRCKTAAQAFYEDRLSHIALHGGTGGELGAAIYGLKSRAGAEWLIPRAPTVEEIDALRLDALPPPEARPKEMTEADIAEIRNRLAKGLVPDLPHGLRIVSDTGGDVERSAFEEIGRRVMMRRMLEDDEGADSNRDVSPDELHAIEGEIARKEAEKVALAAMAPATDSILRAMQMLAAKRGQVIDVEAFTKSAAAAPEPEPVAPSEESAPLEGQILSPSPAPGRRILDL